MQTLVQLHRYFYLGKYIQFCKFGTCKRRIEAAVSKMEITTCTHLESAIEKDTSVVVNALIDMAVK